MSTSARTARNRKCEWLSQRKQRALAAERKAREAAPKLSVVMVLFVFPALFTVIIGPATINVIMRLFPHISV